MRSSSGQPLIRVRTANPDEASKRLLPLLSPTNQRPWAEAGSETRTLTSSSTSWKPLEPWKPLERNSMQRMLQPIRPLAGVQLESEERSDMDLRGVQNTDGPAECPRGCRLPIEKRVRSSRDQLASRDGCDPPSGRNVLHHLDRLSGCSLSTSAPSEEDHQPDQPAATGSAKTEATLAASGQSSPAVGSEADISDASRTFSRQIGTETITSPKSAGGSSPLSCSCGSDAGFKDLLSKRSLQASQARVERDKRKSAATVPASPGKEMKRLAEGKKIFDLFYWEEVLQEQGEGGKVVVCRPKDAANDAPFSSVMKIRSKESLRRVLHEEAYRRAQVQMLNLPPHPGVMALREVFEDEKFYYILMDKASGGFFQSLLAEYIDGVMPTSAVKNLMREILEAVAHLHRHGILHRDIKPDNLVMQEVITPSGAVSRRVNVIDFDHALCDWKPKVPAENHDCCYGTMRFNAPESLLGEYSAGADLYSVGVIMYLLLTGKMPYPDELFDDKTAPHHDEELRSKEEYLNIVYRGLRKSVVDWSCDPWPSQPDSKAVCAKLLAFDISNRFASADEALARPWFKS